MDSVEFDERPILKADFLALEIYVSKRLFSFCGRNIDLPFRFRLFLNSKRFLRGKSHLLVADSSLKGFEIWADFGVAYFVEGHPFPFGFFVSLSNIFRVGWKESIGYNSLIARSPRLLLRGFIKAPKMENNVYLSRKAWHGFDLSALQNVARLFKYIDINLDRWPYDESFEMEALVFYIYLNKMDDPEMRCLFVLDHIKEINSPFLVDSLASKIIFPNCKSFLKWFRCFIRHPLDLAKRFALRLALANKKFLNNPRISDEISRIEFPYYSNNIVSLVKKRSVSAIF